MEHSECYRTLTIFNPRTYDVHLYAGSPPPPPLSPVSRLGNFALMLGPPDRLSRLF